MGSKEYPSKALCATLFPIVLGTGMSSFGSAEFNFFGLVLLCIANTAFPLRTIIYKKIKAATGEDDFTMFYGVCWRAALIMLGVNVGNEIRMEFFSSSSSDVAFSERHVWLGALFTNGVNFGLVLLNGICYFAYLQWSCIVLSKVQVVTHA